MSEKQLTQAIKEARPRLILVSPLAAKIIIIFAVINVLLGLSLATTQATLTTPLAVAPSPGFYQLWGLLFGLLGLVMFWAYRRNSWRIMRHTMVVGMAFKFAWAIALVVRYVSGEFTNPFVLIVWVGLAAIQAVTYVHFMPIPTIEKGTRDANL